MSNAALLKNEAPATNGALGGAAVVVGVLMEPGNERRVSMVPAIAKSLIASGYAVCVQTRAGVKASFGDAAYLEAGCSVEARSTVIRKSDVLLSIMPPKDDFVQMRGKVCISWVSRMFPTSKALIDDATRAGCTLIDVTAVPRITIAQKLDVLSSQAKVAGHRAVMEASYHFERFHSAEITAAGKYPPSQTFVLGCGVAGLAAIGSAKALGSVVRAWDVRDVSDQVVSMGGKWVTVDFKEDATGQGGYAKESSAEFLKAQQATFHKHCKECDVVITTAAIPGRPSPRLLEDYMIKDMKPGSVVVDLAAAGGGNCAITRKGESYVTDNGVTILGFDDLPSRMAGQSSAMYAQNMQNLFDHISGKDKAKALLGNMSKHLEDPEGDIVTRSVICCANGVAYKMPPPPQPTPPKPKTEAAPAPVKADPNTFGAKLTSAFIFAACLGLLLLLGDGVPSTLLSTFVLAGAAGYQAVWGVTHALHTPLMSVTNAISGMTAIGGLLLLDKSKSHSATYLAMASVCVSAVNIFGGFVISQRMLNLFKRKEDKDFSYLMIIPALVLVAVCIGVPSLEKPCNTVAALLCIMAIGSLSSMQSANSGCKVGMAGVLGGLVSTMVHMNEEKTAMGLGLLGVGAIGGIGIGSSVSPIQLPQTVAAFHSLVGLAALLTSVANFYASPHQGPSMENFAACFGDFIGGITLTGSLIAFGKLNGNLSSKPLNLPGKNYLNLCGLAGFVALVYCFVAGSPLDKVGGLGPVLCLWLIAVLACLMGVHLVGSVGGGDMPVCITVLNSYSGWALVAEGFLLNSPMLTIVGSLIGFSGAILTHIMCEAMNRDIFNVIFGGMNTVAPVKKGESAPKTHTETSPEAVAEMLADAKSVMIVPGYGMAVARAQNPAAGLATAIRNNGAVCKFGIHPVAGRMPGQMNVLLAEAGVPYDWVFEMDEINPEMDSVDVCLVVGANDITNKAACDTPGCPIYGMPVIEVWRAKKTIFFKRSMGGGYADIENPVFFMENTDMLLGDAKKTTDSLEQKVKEAIAQRGTP